MIKQVETRRKNICRIWVIFKTLFYCVQVKARGCDISCLDKRLKNVEETNFE